ncbi:hypothetical protein Pfo_011685 [Paulownia fortunei]|nr:hypothetical protein Pfo_011685 [Paulownia fortunei]
MLPYFSFSLKDIATRVIACEVNLVETPVSKVMTRNPLFVLYHTLAVEALQIMVQGKFRHLPVVKNGEVVALLDIAKCLYDAIARMERTAEKGKAIVAAVEGVEKHWGTPVSGPNRFIETFRERMFRPSLSTIISENSKIVTVDPSDTVLVAAKKMLEIRASSAVVTVENKPWGILTSKDMLMRVIAQDLPPESTLVEKVMTPNPKCATIDTPIIDALHTMHDGNFLHLPLIDKDGMVVAVVDALHLTRVVVATMSQEGPSLRRGMMLTSSSSPSRKAATEKGRGGAGNSSSYHRKSTSTSRPIKGLTQEKKVKRLRLSKCLKVPETTSINEACRRMAAHGVDALLVTDKNALLCGILTDKDIAARVIAHEVNLEKTPVSKVMTRNPIFVYFDTLAVEALQKMVQGKFRHLPVVKNGEVIGLLDIEICLYAAIAYMERTATKGKAIVDAVGGVEKHGGTAVFGPSTFIETLREPIFRLSLSTIISEKSKIVTVDPSDTVLVAAKKMLEIRASSAIVSVENRPQGILTSKDMLMRVISQDLPPESTLVEKVMTPNSECATVDTPIVDALHTMRDGKFFHLPVVDNDGMVVAVLDVLHLTLAVVATMSEEGSSLWRSVMLTSSLSPSRKAAAEKDGGGVGNSSSNKYKSTSASHSMGLTGERTVKRLQLSKALIVSETTSISEACRRMVARRVDALLLADSNALLCGILTDKDIARRVIAREVNFEETPVSKVMTRNPVFVLSDTLAVEALEKMVQGKFRHLPVVENGEVIALLGIAKCLYDAIAYIERTATNGRAIVDTVGGPNTFIETFREPIFGLSLSAIVSKKSKIVTVVPSDTVLVVAKKMLEIRASSAIVTVENKPQGILTSKDMLMRVIAQDLPPESTLVEKVMTPNPKCATVDTPIVDALHTMRDGKFLHLPVVDKDGMAIAVVDVLHLTRAALVTSRDIQPPKDRNRGV